MWTWKLTDLEPVPVDPGEGDGRDGVEGELRGGRKVAPGQPTHLQGVNNSDERELLCGVFRVPRNHGEYLLICVQDVRAITRARPYACVCARGYACVCLKSAGMSETTRRDQMIG